MYDREESKKFYQGLVQLSTGCYHFTMKNFKGTESQLSKGIQKLERYQPIYKEMNVTQLLAQFELFLKKIKRLESSKLSQTNLIDQIPKLKFGVS